MPAIFELFYDYQHGCPLLMYVKSSSYKQNKSLNGRVSLHYDK